MSVNKEVLQSPEFLIVMKAINKIEDYFEYSHESEQDKQAVKKAIEEMVVEIYIL